MAEQRELDGTLASAIPGIQHLRERIDELEAENATLRKLCGEMLEVVEPLAAYGHTALIVKAKEILNG